MVAARSQLNQVCAKEVLLELVADRGFQTVDLHTERFSLRRESKARQGLKKRMPEFEMQIWDARAAREVTSVPRTVYVAGGANRLYRLHGRGNSGSPNRPSRAIMFAAGFMWPYRLFTIDWTGLGCQGGLGGPARDVCYGGAVLLAMVTICTLLGIYLMGDFHD